MAAEEKIKCSYCTFVKLLPGNKIAEKSTARGLLSFSTQIWLFIVEIKFYNGTEVLDFQIYLNIMYNWKPFFSTHSSENFPSIHKT